MTTSGSLSKMADQFSGARLINEATKAAGVVEALGGTTKLTGAELQKVGQLASDAAAKLTAMGRDVPPGIQKIIDSTKGAGTEWQNFTGTLDIKNAISDPLGVARGGMSAFAESIGPVAVGAAGLAVGLGAVAAALFEMATSSAAAGAHLNDIGEVTGIAVPQLSKLSNASSIAGTDIQSLSNAVFVMQKNLGESPDKFQRGLERIGVNFADFKALAPEQQLLAIASALQATEDPVQRNTAGFETMGRQFRDIAPSLFKLNDALALTADIQPWTDAQAKQAEQFEMQLQSLKVHAEAFGLSIGRDLIGPISTLISSVTSVAHAFASLNGGFGILPELTAVREGFSSLSIAIDMVRGSVNDLPKVSGDAARGLAAMQASLKDLQINVPNLNDGLIAEKEVIRDLDSETRKHVESAKKFAEIMAQLSAVGVGWQGTLQTMSGSVVEGIRFYLEAGVAQGVLAQAYGVTEAQVKAVSSAMQDEKTSLDATLKSIEEFHKEGEQGAAAVAKSFAGMSVLKDLSVQMGNVQLAGKQFIGVMGLMGDQSEAAAQHMARVRDNTRQVTEVMGLAYDVLGEVGGKFGQLGQIAIGAFDAISQRLAKGDVFGAIVAGATGAVKALGALFGNNAEKQINPIREAFVQLNGGLAELNEKAHAAGVTLTQMLNAKDADQYKAAIDALNGAFKFQDDAMQTLDDTVKKYGFSISELGPTFAAQKLSEQAGSLLQDYQVLTAAGIDHVAIINKMGPALQDYVKQALVTGVAIPEAMRGPLQALADAGQLTDDAGNAMSDLSKLTFAETLDKKFSSLIDTINKLTDAISRGLGTALTNIPQPGAIHIPVLYDFPDQGQPSEPALAARGGLVTDSGVQYLGSGGRVLAWPSRGSDTVRAMLTPGEGVVSRRGMQTLGTGGLSALNAGGNVGGTDMSGVLGEIASLRQEAADDRRLMPKLIRDAILLASQRAA